MQIRVRQPTVRVLLTRLLEAGLTAADPAHAVRRTVEYTGAQLRIGGEQYDLRQHPRVVAVGAGKASARMAAALEGLVKDRLEGGLVVVPYSHAVPTRNIQVLEAGHPFPDRAGQRAAARLLALVGELASSDLLFVLISGGASSLLPAPASGLSLADKRRTTQLLLKSGATIHEVNTVRKHLSAIKGGRLAAATPARVINLILSDVIGDDPGAVGSGPTAPDPTTYADACAVLRRYGLWKIVPPRVRAHVAKGARGGLTETPKPGARVFRRVRNHIIGNNAVAVEATAQAARRLGLHPLVLSTTLSGEAREAAKLFGALAREIHSSGRPISRPACLIAGGELTVTVRGDGKGGRAQEFALAAAREIAQLPHTWVAGFATDGTDGPTDAAGAVVDGHTLARATRLGLDLASLLDRNDAYSVFTRLGGHITTGPTGTNVNDLYLLIAA